MSVLVPPSLPNRIWVVIRPSGERDFIHREPLEGIVTWAKGVNATVAEYHFGKVVHTPPSKKKVTKR